MGFYIYPSIATSANHHESHRQIEPGRYRPSSGFFPGFSSLRRLFKPRVRFASTAKPSRNRYTREYTRLGKLQRAKHIQDYHRLNHRMSSPYVYSPISPLQPTQPQHTPYFHTPRSHTPFIPDANLYNSPYSPAAPLPGSPHSPYAPANVPFPGTGYDVGGQWPDPTWEQTIRQRRPSWHANNPGQSFLQPPMVSPIYNRRHSFGNTTQQQPQYGDWSQLQGGMISPNSYFAQSFHVNPWLNAESPRADFLFDLSSVIFLPLRFYGPGHSVPLPHEELEQPATYPPLTRMRIVCDLIPNWPIDLEWKYGGGGGYSPNPYQAPPPPIKLRDVLVTIQRSLHVPVGQAEYAWAQLGLEDEMAVSRAYGKRCRGIEEELRQGVKRVDFLHKKTRMVGLMRGGKVDGWDVMRLIVSKP